MDEPEFVTVRTECDECGAPIEVRIRIHEACEFFNRAWLSSEEIIPHDPYTYVRLVCENCRMRKTIEQVRGWPAD